MLPEEYNEILRQEATEELHDILSEIENLSVKEKKKLARLIKPYSMAFYEYLMGEDA